MTKRSKRLNILGVAVDPINMATTLSTIDTALSSPSKGYICVTGVHGIMEAQYDKGFKGILNNAMLVTPDGMPTVWIGRANGHSKMGRVYGPDLMLEVCAMSLEKGYSHFIYGGNPGVADALALELEHRFHGIKIVGTHTPPFRPLNRKESLDLKHKTRDLKPDIFWVGLSTPKQERFMAEYLRLLDTKIMIGVGAAFDMHTGLVKQAPSWIQRSGMEWAFRLCQEPRRLAKRYLRNNPVFIYLLAKQITGITPYRLDSE